MSTQLIYCFWTCSACNIDLTLHHMYEPFCLWILNYVVHMHHERCSELWLVLWTMVCKWLSRILSCIMLFWDTHFRMLKHELTSVDFPPFFVSCSLYWFIGGAEEPVAPARKAPLATSAQENNSRGIHSRKSQVTKAWVLHKWFILTVQYDHD